jgi:ketosteroid isomerase-like protein
VATVRKPHATKKKTRDREHADVDRVVPPGTRRFFIYRPVKKGRQDLIHQGGQMSEKNKEIIRKVNAAFEANQPETFLDFCAEDITWHMAGDQPRKGKQSIRDFMASMGDMEPPKINVTAMIAEGDSAVCYGDMTMKEKGTENTYDYCDIYRFAGDKIVELRSFVAKHKAEGEKTATA